MKSRILHIFYFLYILSSQLHAQEDLTHLIVNANLSQGQAGWTSEIHNLGSYSQVWTPMTTTQPCITETYSGFEAHEMDSFKMFQKVALKAGMYRLKGYAFYRWGSSYASDINNTDGLGPRSYAWIKAGNDSIAVMRLGDVSGAELRPTNYANVMIEAAAAFNAGLYRNTLVFTLDNDTTINLGYYGKADRKNCWFICGPMTLERISEEVLQEEKSEEFKIWKERYTELKSKYTSIANQHVLDITFDYTEADVALQKAENIEDVKKAIRLLSDAIGAYMLASKEKFDVTSLIDNPGFESGEMGRWSSLTFYDTGVRECSNSIYTMEGAEGKYLFNSFATSETTANDHHLLQTLSFMPAGSYRMTAELATNQTTNLRLVAGTYFKSITCTSQSQTTLGTLNFNLKTNSDIRIGATSDMWFKADDFKLYFFNETYPFREEVSMAINELEFIARQASDRIVYDSKVEGIKKFFSQINTKAQVDSLKTELHLAIAELLSTVPAKNGLYDLTCLIKNNSFNYGTQYWTASSTTTISEGIAELFNSTSTYKINQTIKNMPNGWYTVTVKGFSRTTDIDATLNKYLTGAPAVRAYLTIGSKSSKIKGIFEDYRFATNSSSMDYKGLPNGASVPNTMHNASKLFNFGHYSNVLRYEKTGTSNITIGLKQTGGDPDNWLAFDDFRLYYGKNKNVNLDTLTIPEAIYANISSQRTLKAGILEAISLPYDADINLFDEVYVLGYANCEKAVITPATEMKAGHPYFVRVSQDTPISATDVLLSSINPDSIPALWNGTFQKARYSAGTVNNVHILSADGKHFEYVNEKEVPAGTPCFYLAKSQFAEGKNIPVEIHDDWMDMDFDVNIENFKVEEFLSNTKYTRSTPSVVNSYNTAPTWRRDQPRSATIPFPAFNDLPKKITITYSQYPDMSNSISMNVSKNATQWNIYNLIPGNTYYYKVIADEVEVTKGKFTAQGRIRMLGFNSGSNMRDMGGWTTEDGKMVQYGKIYRGGELHSGFETNMSAEDLKNFAALGLAAEFDLRNNDQVQNNVGPNNSALGESVPYRYMNQYLFGDDALKEDTLIYREAFNFFADNLNAGSPIYFHCIWGADRTGAMAMLLNGLLGVGEDQLYKDYELTSFSKAGLREKSGLDTKFDYLSQYGGSIQEQIYRYLSEYVKVPKSKLNDIIRHMLNDGDTNSIIDAPNSITDSPDAPIYDLMGRIVTSPTKRGIYIRNGKKFIVR